MTLRLFRRKPGTTARSTAQPSASEPKSQASDTTKRAPRRRGGPANTPPVAPATPTAVTAADVAAPEKRSGRSRRGRRGGVRQKAKRAAAEAASARHSGTAQQSASAQQPAAKPIELHPVKDGARPTNFEELAEAQLDTLRGLQDSLSAIESRLAGITRTQAEQRVGVFVDVPNIMYSAERLKTTIDYEKLLKYLLRGRELVRASAYAPISDDPQEPIQTQRFVHPFMGHGYRLVTKPLKRFSDGSIKANFDIELAIDILTMCDRLDTVVLLSGDSDFRRLVDLVTSKGVRVEVAAFGESTAAELRAAADEYTDLRTHLAEFRAK